MHCRSSYRTLRSDSSEDDDLCRHGDSWDVRIVPIALHGKHVSAIMLTISSQILTLNTRASSSDACYQSQIYRKRLQTAVGTTVKLNQRIDQLNQIVVPLPPTKAEQEAIAEALSDADALIESLEQLLAKKRHLKQGAMQELLTGKKRLPGFSGEWEVKRLGETGRLQKWHGVDSDRSSDQWRLLCIRLR